MHQYWMSRIFRKSYWAKYSGTDKKHLEEWGVLYKTRVGLRDSAEAMKKALNIGNLETLIVGISCLIHLLQLCLKENLLELPSVKTMVEKFRRASQLENQSQAFHNEFHKQQRIQNPEKKPLNLVQDVPTRFNRFGQLLLILSLF